MEVHFRTFARAVAIKVAAAALIAGLAGCANTPFDAGPVAQPVGAVFLRAQKDSGSYGSGETVQVVQRAAPRQWKGAQVFPMETRGGPTLLQDADGRWMALVTGDRPVLSWEPPLGIPGRLHVGQTLKQNLTVTNHGSGRSQPLEVDFKIDAFEDVKTRAGTFRAFRMHIKDNLGNNNLVWYSPELGVVIKSRLERTAAHSQGPGIREQDLVSQTIRY